jgi:hypothetical protein
VLRNVDRPAPSALEVASGTEGSLGAAPLRLLSGTGAPPAIPAQQRVQPIPVQATEVKPPPAGETPVRPALQSVLLSVPLQAQAGREFAAAVSVPPGVAGNVRLDLVYDAARLQAVGIEGTPGRAQLVVSGTTAVRFLALEGQVGPTQISVANISAVGLGGENIALSAPVPVTVNITP